MVRFPPSLFPKQFVWQTLMLIFFVRNLSFINKTMEKNVFCGSNARFEIMRFYVSRVISLISCIINMSET